MIEKGIVQPFEPVSLEALEALSLMNRTDTKCVFHVRLLPELLAKVAGHYLVLEINNQRLMPYTSTYFDTPDYLLYTNHHNGVLARYKVRFRDYLISDRTFFELKRKTNKSRTKKKRMEVPFRTQEIAPEGFDFLAAHSPLAGVPLIKVLENRFTRITLAGFATNERVTLDVDMEYVVNGKNLALEGLVIAEIKRGRASTHSPMMQALHEMHITPSGFSKYCIGIVSLVEGVKYNNFKPKLLNLKKILG
jgi:hypothetical protein